MLRLRLGGQASRLANESCSRRSLARTSLWNTPRGAGGLSWCCEYLRISKVYPFR